LLTVAEDLAVLKAAWGGFRGWREYQRAGRIQITSPRPLESLEDKQPFRKLEEGRFSYAVRGKLRRRPDDCEIWLLIEDRSGCVWPQGFSPVQFDPEKGEWIGRVHTQNPQPKIVAVVAPPTSQEFFKYYQQMDNKTNYAALNRVPVECTNRTSVDARLPP
jgi:hypothetical protein